MIESASGLGLRLPQDAQGFVRRACPECTRQFKTAGRTDEALVVQTTFSAMVSHANDSELQEPAWRYCPYCGHRAPASAFLTVIQRNHLRTWADWLSSVIRYERLRQPQRQLSENPYVTYLAVAPPRSIPPLPREPDDLFVSPFPCCGEQLKIEGAWGGPLFCHYCRARAGRRSAVRHAL